MVKNHTLFKITIVLCVLVTSAGCSRNKRIHDGGFFEVKLPYGWEEASKSDNIVTPFYSVSKEEVVLATYISPEKTEYGAPLATMSIYVQKFHRPLWAEDMGFELKMWLDYQGYTILGQGKIFHKKAVGYSVNYRDETTQKVYLDFYFTTDHKMYLVMSGVTSAELFHQYVYDFEVFREGINFSLLTFYL